jgi:hypothetical protein
MWVAVALVFWGGASNGEVYQYVEDFTTTQYKDPVYTTAWWNTSVGELYLYPYIPTLTSAYDTPGFSQEAFVAGDHVFVADHDAGLLVFDISDLGSPVLVGSYNTPGYSYGVFVAGDHAFVADYGSGLQVIDISDPSSPTLAGSYNTPGISYDVYISGDHAFIADQSSGLTVVDISNPASPTMAGTYDTPGSARGLCVSGNYAFVGDLTYGLQVIDISDPTSPSLAGNYDTPGAAWGIDVSGDHAYVADYSSGLQVIDISDPTVPVAVGSASMTGLARRVAVSGDRAFVAAGVAGLQTVDISDPTSPDPGRLYDTPDDAYNVHVSGNHAFVADADSGLLVIEIAQPALPALTGSYYTAYALDLHVYGDHVFMADQSSLHIININDPTSPAHVSWYVGDDLAHDVFVSGDYAYLADGSFGGLKIIDISNPATPTLLGSYQSPGTAKDVFVSGDYAYLADEGTGLLVIDISNPTAPAQVGNYLAVYARGVDVSGDRLYMASATSGLRVIDITNPATPTLIATYDTPNWASDVHISGNHAFVADYGSGLQVIDISDPSSPTLAGSYDTPGNASGINVSGNYAFVADGQYGLQMIDVSDPTSPSLVSSYDTPDDAYGVHISGEHAFVADLQSGLQIIQVFQSEVYTQYNKGQSLNISTTNNTVIQARLTTTQTDDIAWELSADGAANWQGITPDGSWFQLADPGDDLRWRSFLTWHLSGDDPRVENLEIDWLYDCGVIEAVSDVGNDQGSQARIEWTRSSFDFVGASPQIVEYAVYRKHDPASVAGPEPAPALEGWDYVTTVPAEAEQHYSVVAPTLKDSTVTEGMHYTTFLIRARTATTGVHFDSAPDSGYSLDNLEPHVPSGLVVAYNTGGGNQLSWEPCPDEDFNVFRIYRSNDPDFTPSPENLADETTGTEWQDPVHGGGGVHYKITAVDLSGNESEATGPGSATGVTEMEFPRSFALHQNVPNPFNPTTTIAFDLPERASVKLAIFDVSGKLIRTLVDAEMAPGHKSVGWDGRDTAGREVASGVYFYRLETPEFGQSRKMLLLR